MRRAVQIKVVGDEAVGHAGDLQLLDHRMPAFHDLQVATVFQIRPAIVAIRCNCGEAGEHVDFGQRQRGLANARASAAMAARNSANRSRSIVDHLLLRIQNLRFVFLQLGRGEALGIHQRLLALVIGGA